MWGNSEREKSVGDEDNVLGTAPRSLLCSSEQLSNAKLTLCKARQASLLSLQDWNEKNISKITFYISVLNMRLTINYLLSQPRVKISSEVWYINNVRQTTAVQSKSNCESYWCVCCVWSVWGVRPRPKPSITTSWLCLNVNYFYLYFWILKAINRFFPIS